MTALALVFLLGGLEFVQQDIPALYVDVEGATGTVTAGFLQADLDGNGALDIILPDRVLFQIAGSFDPAKTAKIPDLEDGAALDVCGQQVFLRLPKVLRVVRWDGVAWKTELDQPVQWPSSTYANSPEHNVRKQTAQIDRFLHDLDGDRIPEIVVPAENGLHVFHRAGETYAPAGVLDVFPPLRLSRTSGQRLWPPEARNVLFPARRMSCRFVLEQSNAIVLFQEGLADDKVRYVVSRFGIEKSPEGLFHAGKQAAETGAPVPSFVTPCRLNRDDLIDYCGGDWDWSSANVIPCPIYQTIVSTDGGRTLQTVRTTSFRPRVSAVDFDGDGDMDLVAENTGLLDGGTRESASRLASSARVNHEIRIHYQDSAGVFSKLPDVTGTFTVELDAPPIAGSHFFWKYQAGELFDITGDFNGDGRKDLLIHQRPDTICLYLSDEEGFSERPAGNIRSSADRQFAVYDVDGDRRSDTILRWYEQDARRTQSGAVFLTREGSS